jgi:catechol 2,3-dioxygenase-like lactoylglutathione lyase family enzyme
MGFHHVAIATRDPEATHAFYTEAMGFDLVKVEAVPTDGGGWARHLFYDTGGQGLIAFWEIHDDPKVRDDFDPSISRGLGLPMWTNHLAFDAGDLNRIEECKQRWLETGYDVAEIDHGWCTSIYITDPNGILIEFCATTEPFADTDREDARGLRTATAPPVAPEPTIVVHEASRRARA